MILSCVHVSLHTTIGTSTGGIIAALCGLECYPIVQCEAMYDALIKDIFQRHPTGGVKLALKQAFYDEENWMSILKGIVSVLKVYLAVCIL
jgi:hypothetical protein